MGAHRGVVLFSTRGDVSPVTRLSGGDYDGDVFWVCANPDILRPLEAKVASPCKCKATRRSRIFSASMLVRCFTHPITDTEDPPIHRPARRQRISKQGRQPISTAN